MKNNKHKRRKELDNEDYTLVEAILVSLGDSVVYPIKTLLNIQNRENADLKVIIMKKKKKHKTNSVIDLQVR